MCGTSIPAAVCDTLKEANGVEMCMREIERGRERREDGVVDVVMVHLTVSTCGACERMSVCVGVERRDSTHGGSVQ